MPINQCKILFVCIGNACRSQMAEGIARHLLKNDAEIYSAGSRPAGFVSIEAVHVMQEIKIDISKQFSKSVQEVPQIKYDAIVTMGCGDACPQIPAVKRYDWNIPDPIGESFETFRSVRDLLYKNIKSLLKELKNDDE